MAEDKSKAPEETEDEAKPAETEAATAAPAKSDADNDGKPEAANKSKGDDASAETAAEGTPKKTPKRKKAKRTVSSGQVHVQASFNNTIITFTDSKGNVLTTSSAGACGFRGSKKGTAYAAQVAAERAAQTAKQQFGFSKADVLVKGIGLGRDAAVRVLSGMDIAVESIKDVTGVPHGGVRPPKARRI